MTRSTVLFVCVQPIAAVRPVRDEIRARVERLLIELARDGKRI